MTAQIVVKGTVVDYVSGEKVPLANIIEIDTNNYAVSDTAGNFQIIVRSNKSVIKISSLGYKPEIIDLKKYKGDTIIIKARMYGFVHEHIIYSKQIGFGIKSVLNSSSIGGKFYYLFPKRSNAIQFSYCTGHERLKDLDFTFEMLPGAIYYKKKYSTSTSKGVALRYHENVFQNDLYFTSQVYYRKSYNRLTCGISAGYQIYNDNIFKNEQIGGAVYSSYHLHQIKNRITAEIGFWGKYYNYTLATKQRLFKSIYMNYNYTRINQLHKHEIGVLYINKQNKRR